MNRWLSALVLWLALLPACAHEESANRATLVLRETNHVSLTLRINLHDLIHDVLTPKLTATEFLEQFAAMPPSEFETRFQSVQRLVQSDTRMALPSGKKVDLSQWRWPAPQTIQAQIRDTAMQLVVAPHDHPLEAASEVYVEATSKEDLSEVSLHLAQALESVLVVYYRPRQVWIGPKKTEARIRF